MTSLSSQKIIVSMVQKWEGFFSLLMENLSMRDDYCSNSVVKVVGGWWVDWVVFSLIGPVLSAHATPIKTNCKAIKTVYWVITNGELRLLQTRGSHKKEIWFFEQFILPKNHTIQVYWHKILKGEPFCIIIRIKSVRNLEISLGWWRWRERDHNRSDLWFCSQTIQLKPVCLTPLTRSQT